MNFKRSTTSMAIALMVLSLISVTAIQQDAFAQRPQQGMEITATADKGSDTIMIMGQTISAITDVTLTVVAPNGNVVTIDQVSPADNGIFETVFKVGPTWSEDGFYTITAMQSVVQNSLYTLSVEVEVVNGMVASNTSVTESTLETGIILAYSYPKDTRDRGLEINAEAEMGSDIIEITGMTDRVSTDVTLTVVAPNGNIVSIDQVSPADNGEFTSVITTGGPLWTQDGIYTVTAKQFDDFAYTASTEVDIKDGLVVPEFGTIAAMILAVAIVSIIAVSAKSRLSIMPRY
jgi:predicted secreted protein with PEFG-CTERM motif